ncbi:MAG TPA: hypothetical protein VE753_09790 [Gaiellaceae bacterium]|nr:hypothetical protein [Gaiellaceae bacterium]
MTRSPPCSHGCADWMNATYSVPLASKAGAGSERHGAVALPGGPGRISELHVRPPSGER